MEQINGSTVCARCKERFEAIAYLMPPQEAPGTFYSIDTVCPHCGLKYETVLKIDV
jgi:DNA-directed RNA polymerase subunit RPC12/RpoP